MPLDDPTSEGSVLFGQFTDEELCVLTPERGIAMLPLISEMSEDHRHIAEQTAYRSLIARGILQPPSQEGDEPQQPAASDPTKPLAQLPEVLADMLTLREGAEQIVAVSLMTSIGEESRYAYAAGAVVLEEHVDAAGFHTFYVGSRDRLTDIVMSWALHPAATDGEGAELPPTDPEEVVPPEELLETLGDALLRADIVIRYVDDSAPPLIGIFSGPGGTWLSIARLGSGEQVRIAPVSLASVRRTLDEELAAAPR